MNLTAAPAFFDNDIRVIDDLCKGTVVDPVEQARADAALEATPPALAAILVTHHRIDRVGRMAAAGARREGRVRSAAHDTTGQRGQGPIEQHANRTWENGFR